jgi:flagellar motor protein MotB
MNKAHPLLNYALRTQKKNHLSLMSDSWATSFSDLVTLLLCFFLTMISFGPLGKPINNPVVTNPNSPGISLALEGKGVTRRTFGLTSEELSKVDSDERPEVVVEMLSAVLSGGYLKKEITVTVFPETQSEQRGLRLMSIIQRLSGIHRQLIDAAPGAQVLLRVAPVTHVEAEYAALIEVEDLGK